jgi:hypothetical protein
MGHKWGTLYIATVLQRLMLQNYGKFKGLRLYIKAETLSELSIQLLRCVFLLHELLRKSF